MVRINRPLPNVSQCHLSTLPHRESKPKDPLIAQAQSQKMAANVGSVPNTLIEISGFLARKIIDICDFLSYMLFSSLIAYLLDDSSTTQAEMKSNSAICVLAWLLHAKLNIFYRIILIMSVKSLVEAAEDSVWKDSTAMIDSKDQVSEVVFANVAAVAANMMRDTITAALVMAVVESLLIDIVEWIVGWVVNVVWRWWSTASDRKAKGRGFLDDLDFYLTGLVIEDTD